MQIFAGIPGEGTSNHSGVIVNVNFQDFGRYVFGTLGNQANISIIYSVVAFPLTPKHVSLNDHFALNFQFSTLLKFGWNGGRCSQQKTCNISETGQDRTKVTINDQ